MKNFSKDLKVVAKQLNTLARQTESLASALDTTPKKTASAKKPVRVAATARKAPTRVSVSRSTTPTDQVLTIMKRFRKGITVDALRSKSGFNEKQISNIVHRACKKGKMKRVSRGLYSVY